MKHIIKTIFCIFLLSNTVVNARVIPYVSIRSQSENAARELVIWQKQINRFGQDHPYACFSVTPGYSRSFKPEKVAHWLFCEALDNDCCQTSISRISIQGSNVTNRNENALLADYFGLPMDYNSYVIMQPQIENFLVDCNLYVGFAQNFYFRIHAPIVHTRWDLDYCEITSPSPFTTGSADHPGGYFNGKITDDIPNIVPRTNLVGTFAGFASYRETPLIEGVTFQPLQHARLSPCKLTDNALAEIQMAIGWNFCNADDYHVGLNLRAAAPTGTRPCACWLFEPIVGNGKHWEVGAGFTSHWRAWHRNDKHDDFSIYLDANLTHLAKARQCRTFDLCNKPLSRYMLAQRMTTPSTNLFDANGNQPEYQFNNEFAPVANLTTIPVDVSAAIQLDMALKFAYTHNHFQFDLGYNLWIRSCEKVCPRISGDQCNNSTWALKGDAFVYGFTLGENSLQAAIPLSASERDSSVFCGNNNPQRTVSNDFYWERNPGIDNPQLAYTNGAVPLSSYVTTWRTVYSSFEPYVFSTANTSHLNIKNAQSRGISHKFFTAFGYTWKEHDCWTPFMGVNIEVEFGQSGNNCCNSTARCKTKSPTDTATTYCQSCSCNDCEAANSVNRCCKRCSDCGCLESAISQWGVWVKGGFSYN